ncbi:MAG TPA: L,D-transpeptidase [Solirubrobacteraceae bacterium]|nr:L,D-transpeptidase [Solirubrobacteraceae bacterium]
MTVLESRNQTSSSSRWLILVAPGAVLVAVIVVFAVFATSKPSVAADGTALAKVDMALGGGSVVSVHVTGPRGRTIPVTVSGGRIVPRVKVRPNERVSIVAVIHRPGWIGWLAGSTDTERLSLTTPTTSLSDQYLTLAAGAALRLSFSHPVSTFAYGQPGALHHRTFAQPQAQVTVTPPASAGTLAVAAAPRAWEKQSTSFVTWFPAGAGPSAVISPAPGTQISSTTPITLTFSKPYAQLLGSGMPKLSPAATGNWKTLDSHTIEFKPNGYGFGLGASVSVALPNGTSVIGTHGSTGTSTASWTVPQGASLRVNQILAQLGYLPVTWHPASQPVGLTPSAQLKAAINPPAGSFTWNYGNTPAALKGMFDPNHQTVVTQGALMAFEQNQNMYGTDPGPAQVWHALITAAVKDQRSSFGYTFVTVTESSQSLSLWHSGHTVMSTPVNTGIPGAATATGVYPVYEHIPSGTMSGTNPDGSHYNDPGIPWISYFNGGDALHGFVRASYGSPQSLGCVEMPPATAGRVYPYTPIGTLVNVV